MAASALTSDLSALNHGIYIPVDNNNLENKTFVCRLKNDSLEFGFVYSKGKRFLTLRVSKDSSKFKYKIMRAIKEDEFIICFKNVTTNKSLAKMQNGEFSTEDVRLDWFNNSIRELIQAQLPICERNQAVREEVLEEINELMNSMSITELENIRDEFTSKRLS